MHGRNLVAYLAICFLIAAYNAGCQRGESPRGDHTANAEKHAHDHDHEHATRPESFDVAVAELVRLSEQFDDAMAREDLEAAHEPLHDLGELIKILADLAADSDLSEEHWTQIKQSSDELFAAYQKVDAAFHRTGSDKNQDAESVKSVYDNVQEDISRTIEEIRAHATSQSSAE